MGSSQPISTYLIMPYVFSRTNIYLKRQNQTDQWSVWERVRYGLISPYVSQRKPTTWVREVGNKLANAAVGTALICCKQRPRRHHWPQLHVWRSWSTFPIIAPKWHFRWRRMWYSILLYKAKGHNCLLVKCAVTAFRHCTTVYGFGYRLPLFIIGYLQWPIMNSGNLWAIPGMGHCETWSQESAT